MIVDERRLGEALEPTYDFRCLESDVGSLLANLPCTFGMQKADIYEPAYESVKAETQKRGPKRAPD